MGGELTGVAIPFVVFVLMAIVGSEIVPADFRRVIAYPRAVVVGTLGQTFLVPAMAALVVSFLAVAPSIAAAILILALCPGGILSNFYCAVARKNVALSVTLTVVSSLVCVVTIPVVGAVILSMVPGSIAAAVPIDIIVAQLLTFMILPIAVGLILRRLFERKVMQLQRRLHMLGLVLIIIVGLLAAWEERAALMSSLVATALPASVFTIGALVLGSVIAILSGVADRVVIGIELAVRNIPIALVIGTALGQSTMLSFSLAYLLTHVPIVLGYALISRSFGRAASSTR